MKKFTLPELSEQDLQALSQVLEEYIRIEANQGRARIASLKTAPILNAINCAQEVKKDDEI